MQPCVRPVSAVRITAGHNALGGSGPGQKPAFDDALAHVGCPDRRIDRLCITCCSPSQPSTSRRMTGAISFTPQARRVPCRVRPWPSWPKPFWRACWRRDGGNLGRTPRQQCGQPGPMLCAMDLGIADDGERTGGEQAAQIAIALLADTTELVLAPARVLLRHEPDPGGEVPS